MPGRDLLDASQGWVRLLIIDAAELQIKKWNSNIAAPSDTPLVLQVVLNDAGKLRTEIGSAGLNVLRFICAFSRLTVFTMTLAAFSS